MGGCLSRQSNKAENERLRRELAQKDEQVVQNKAIFNCLQRNRDVESVLYVVGTGPATLPMMNEIKNYRHILNVYILFII